MHREAVLFLSTPSTRGLKLLISTPTLFTINAIQQLFLPSKLYSDKDILDLLFCPLVLIAKRETGLSV